VPRHEALKNSYENHLSEQRGRELRFWVVGQFENDTVKQKQPE
jgi:hypothetical protein